MRVSTEECNGPELALARALCITMRCRQHKTSCHTWGDRQPTPGYSRTGRLSASNTGERRNENTGRGEEAGETERDVKTTITRVGERKKERKRGRGSSCTACYPRACAHETVCCSCKARPSPPREISFNSLAPYGQSRA